MTEKIDYALQDCAGLYRTIDANLAAMQQKGFDDERYNALKSAETGLRQKEQEQEKAAKLVIEKTAGQNAAIEKTGNTIRQIQNAGKSAFGNDKAMLNKFRIGENLPTSVKRLSNWAEYFSGLANENRDILLKNGMSEADLSDCAGALLVAADAEQENAKKKQAAATLLRDKALKNLKDQMTRTRSFAKACFDKNPEILVQFKPLPKGRGKGGSGDASGNEEEKK
jgi:hypothetical protein